MVNINGAYMTTRMLRTIPVARHIDGHDYFYALSEALDSARDCIFILVCNPVLLRASRRLMMDPLRTGGLHRRFTFVVLQRITLNGAWTAY